jgi:dedicator of cytokinesis protein 3
MGRFRTSGRSNFRGWRGGAIWGQYHNDALYDCSSHTSFKGYQTEMSNLVGHVVNLCLSHHDQLRTNAVQMLYTMVLSEWHSSENFDDIENEVVNKLDSLFMSDSKGDELSKTLFLDQLRQMFISSQVDERLGGRVAEFLSSVESFLELLLSVRALPDGEEFSDDRVIATVCMLLTLNFSMLNYIRTAEANELHSTHWER